jgi:hypothetical protein
MMKFFHGQDFPAQHSLGLCIQFRLFQYLYGNLFCSNKTRAISTFYARQGNRLHAGK